MNKPFSGLLGLLALAILAAGCCDPSLVGSATVPLRPQETNNWCWAAVTEMVAESFSIPVNQCDLANQRFGERSCCTPEERDGCPKNDECNRPGWTMFDEVGVAFGETTEPLSWESIRKQIACLQRPLAYAYGPTGGGVGHVVVIYGYAELAGQRYLYIKDPWGPCNGNDYALTYETYASGSSRVHWRTWHTFFKKP